jgi:sugar lactone lactonase YvrE
MKKTLPFSLLILLCIAACSKKSKEPEVTTYAGTGAMGSVNGSSTEATFSYLMGLAIDTAGNVYVADSHNNLIRKISTDGTVTTLAGSGTVGSADGKGAAASFFNPAGVAVDKSGIVYVADTHNNLIRKISADGTVSTVRGKWAREAINKFDTAGRYDNPMGIAVDAAGNIYVADWEHDQVRKVSADGKITTLAGTGERGSEDGAGAKASFYLPEGIAADKEGNVYVTDTYNNLIRKIDTAGVVTTIAGKIKKGRADGKGTAASFFHPDGIAVDKNHTIYIADTGNHLIRKISPGGVVTTVAGSGTRGSEDGSPKAASFNRPMGIAVDAAGNVYVADYQNNLVRRIGY